MATNTRYHWYDYRTGAEYLGITERQLRRAVQAGKVEHTRLGLKLRFTAEMLDRFVAASTHGGAA